jgi:hypothetical protein
VGLLAINVVFELESQLAVKIEVRNSSDCFNTWILVEVFPGEKKLVCFGDAGVAPQELVLDYDAATFDGDNILTLGQSDKSNDHSCKEKSLPHDNIMVRFKQ